LFRITNNYRCQVRLTGHGYKYSLVRKALQRNGILANRNVESAITIETRTERPDTFLLQAPGTQSLTISSIETLLDKILTFFQSTGNHETHIP